MKALNNETPNLSPHTHKNTTTIDRATLLFFKSKGEDKKEMNYKRFLQMRTKINFHSTLLTLQCQFHYQNHNYIVYKKHS